MTLFHTIVAVLLLPLLLASAHVYGLAAECEDRGSMALMLWAGAVAVVGLGVFMWGLAPN